MKGLQHDHTLLAGASSSSPSLALSLSLSLASVHTLWQSNNSNKDKPSWSESLRRTRRLLGMFEMGCESMNYRYLHGKQVEEWESRDIMERDDRTVSLYSSLGY